MKNQFYIVLVFILLSEFCFAVTPSASDDRALYVPGADSVHVSGLKSSRTNISRGITRQERWRNWWIGELPVKTTESSTPPHLQFAVPLAVRTNLLYDAILLPNIGLSTVIGDRITVGAGWMGTWLNDSKHHYYRIYGGDLDLTYRLGGAVRVTNPFSGHHVGAYASIVYYDIQRGRSHRGYMSAKYNYAAGITYTYSHPLSRHFDIAFTIGVGYMWGKYMRHTPVDDHDVWLYTKKRSWFGPTRAAVSLVWVFGKAYNEKKGGAR